METPSLSRALGKLSNLLTQESDLLLGVEPYIKSIEDLLHGKADLLELRLHQRKIDTMVIGINIALYELMIRAEHRQKKDAFIQYLLTFGVFPNDLLLFMIVMDLIDHSKLVRRLSQICSKIEDALQLPPCGIYYGGIEYYGAFQTVGGSFEERFDGEFGNAIISRAIRQLEALEAEKQLRPPVKRQVMWLCDKFKCFQDFLKDVDIEKLSREDMVWVYELFEVCLSANTTLSSSVFSLQRQRMKERKWSLNKLFRAVPNLISQNKIAKKIAEIRDQVSDLSNRTPKLISTPISLHTNIRISPAVSATDELDIVSFDEDVDAIIEKLLVDDTHCIAISILGAAGIGKTSLAKIVYTNNQIVHYFPLRVWVQGATEDDIIEKISGVIGCLKENQVIKMVAEKRSLIVIDDSCARDCWTKLRGIFCNSPNGSRVIFTAGKQKEAPLISKTNFNYKLHLRTDNESWALFVHALELNISSQLEKEMKDLILRKCGGLPKVIVNLARLLSKTEPNPEKWSRVVQQVNQDEEPWSKILQEINNYLPLYLRRCLFYFGLFPADCKIPARRSKVLWVAEGLVSKQTDGSSPESIAEKCLEELVNYNMVQVTERKIDGKIKTCCLPEALRLHWLEKAKEANFLHGRSNTTTGIRRVSDHLNPNDSIFHHIHGNDYENLYPFYRNSVAFLSFDSREDAGQDIGNFLSRCISGNCFFFLLVLDLETVYRPKLPKALGKLMHLRYLGLRSTYLERLPVFIDKLLSLQTLDLKRTCINTLPRSIWKMQKLRHLFLDQSYRTVFLPRLEESSLDELQTLWGVFVDENSPVKNGLQTMPNVTKLGLKSKLSMASRKEAMTIQLKALENWVMSLKSLERLRLKSFDELEQPWDLHLDSLSDHTDLNSVYLVGNLKNQQLVSKLPPNLRELTLSGSRLVDDPMQALGKLPNLQILKLFSKSFIGEKMVCSSGGFPKLKVLKLWELENLEAWDVDELSLPNLKDLEIRHCASFKILPDGLQHMKTLRKLKLTKLPLLSGKMKEISGGYLNNLSHVLDVSIEN